MTITQLRHFIALAEHGSFAQTASAVFLSQPALTRSIQALEEDLGQLLFDRVGRQISLTAFGREALRRAQLILADIDSLQKLAPSMVDGMAGELRLGLGSGPGMLFSTRLLAHCAAYHPQLHLSLSRGNTATLLEGVRTQRLDAALVDIRSMRPSAVFQVGSVFQMSAGFLVRHGHPLLQKRSVDLPAIRAFPIASTPLSDEIARALIATYGSAANPDELVTLRSDETHHIIDVSRYSDVVVLTILAAAENQLVPLPMRPALKAMARFGLVTLAGRQPAPALEILNDPIRDWVEALGGVFDATR